MATRFLYVYFSPLSFGRKLDLRSSALTLAKELESETERNEQVKATLGFYRRLFRVEPLYDFACDFYG